MTPEEKTNYLHIALALSDIGVTDEVSELIWTTYEVIQKKKGQFNLEDACRIKQSVKEKYHHTKEIEDNEHN